MFEHFGAVEADFQSHYGMDLREVLWGDRAPGVRRVLSLVNGLPETSAMYREVAFSGKSWSTTDELLATLVEITDAGNLLFFSANSEKNAKGWDPVSIPRPGAAVAKPREMATSSEMSAVFGESAQYTGEKVSS